MNTDETARADHNRTAELEHDVDMVQPGQHHEDVPCPLCAGRRPGDAERAAARRARVELDIAVAEGSGRRFSVIRQYGSDDPVRVIYTD